MGMKDSKHLLALMTMAMMFESNKEDCGYYNEVEEKEEKKPIIPKNHKEFFYGLNSIFALNKRNADKKAKSKGYL